VSVSLAWPTAINAYDSRDYPEPRSRLPADYEDLQDLMQNLYNRGRRSDPGVGTSGYQNNKKFSRVYRGSKPLFLSNHADAVMRGLG